MTDIRVLQAGQTPRRKTRTPSFGLAGNIMPYGLYPLMIHPVLPGETMNSAALKIRVQSQPLKYQLAGAWLETWLVYVKLTDIDEGLGQMFVSENVDNTDYQATADSDRHFVRTGQVDWVRLCLDRIHEAYFLDEDETARTIDGVPMVKMNNASWYQNVIFQDADETVPTTDAMATYEHLQGWAMLQQMQMTELTYEQYLGQYGAVSQLAKPRMPEILRFSRSWKVGSQTVDPDTGDVATRIWWDDEIKMEKAKRFNEPGFVVHLATMRPKMFNSHTRASMVNEMWGFKDWFPAYALEDPTSTVKELSSDAKVFEDGARGASATSLLYDHSDLLAHGENFVNCWDRTDAADALPLATGLSVADGASVQDMRGQYPTTTDVASLFTTDPSTTGKSVLYDGIETFKITGHVVDNTVSR